MRSDAEPKSPTTLGAHRSPLCRWSWIAGALAGALLTPPTMFAAIVSGGGGHGHYEVARAAYPFAMLLTRLTQDHIGWLAVAAAAIELPLYGALLGSGAGAISRRWRPVTAIIAVVIISVVIAHWAAAVACFSGAVPNFS